MIPNCFSGCKTLALTFVFIPLLSSSTSAQDWTRFRGPNGTGLSEATTIPTQWTATDYNWKVKLPGNGHSSPVLWGRRIFVTAAKAAKFSVLCLDEQTGGILWHRDFPQTSYALHKFSSFASGTCAVDDERYQRHAPGHRSGSGTIGGAESSGPADP